MFIHPAAADDGACMRREGGQDVTGQWPGLEAFPPHSVAKRRLNREHDVMAPRAQAAGEAEEWIEVAANPDGGEDDARHCQRIAG